MKFNLGVYHKLSKDDKTAYASSFEISQKKSPMQPRMFKIKPPKKQKQSKNTPKIKGGGKSYPKGNTYYDWDKNYNKGWLPGGSDNPITTFAKGLIKITTGIDIPNPNKVKMDNPEIKTWEDRNISNRRTKLNP